jgi:hypothetical protein
MQSNIEQHNWLRLTHKVFQVNRYRHFWRMGVNIHCVIYNNCIRFLQVCPLNLLQILLTLTTCIPNQFGAKCLFSFILVSAICLRCEQTRF